MERGEEATHGVTNPLNFLSLFVAGTEIMLL